MKLSEYVTQVINDPKYGHDIEWVKGNLSREHIEQIEAAHDAEVRAGEAAQWAQAVLVSGLQGERIGAARAVVAEEPEWEYGYTSKWGTITASCQADAESRAADHARGIADRRESGDLTYHGKVVKRIAAPKPGEWVLVKQEGAETDG